MRREGSRIAYFIQRILTDMRSRVAGLRIAIPVGDGLARSRGTSQR
jgi:hypothetical protein